MRCLLILLSIIIISCTSTRHTNDYFLKSVTYDYISDVDDYLQDNEKESLSRIITDFNNDGLDDVLITGYYKGAWGNAGGVWNLYYQTKDSSMIKCDETVSMHPDEAYYNSQESQIVLFARSSCCEGNIIFLKVSNCTIKPIKKITCMPSRGM